MTARMQQVAGNMVKTDSVRGAASLCEGQWTTAAGNTDCGPFLFGWCTGYVCVRVCVCVCVCPPQGITLVAFCRQARPVHAGGTAPAVPLGGQLWATRCWTLTGFVAGVGAVQLPQPSQTTTGPVDCRDEPYVCRQPCCCLLRLGTFSFVQGRCCGHGCSQRP
jgi:hypothetical protein